MALDLLKPLWHKLNNEPPCFSAGEFQQVFTPNPKSVLELRVLQQTTSSLTATCRECGSAHIGTVQHLLNRRTGRLTVHTTCPTCGPTKIEPDELRRWIVHCDTILRLVLTAVGGRGEPAELVPGHVWHLGNVSWCGRSRETYFVRCLHESSRAAITALLARHPKAVILFPTEDAARKWTVASNPAFALESILTFDSSGLKFDPTAVEGRFAAAGQLDPVKPKPKPAGKQDRLAGKIQRLTAAVVEHLRAAAENARETRRLGGAAILLPRPKKNWLAKYTKMSPSEVSKCFKHEDAGPLRVYWRTAASLDAVLKFSGPVDSEPAA